MPINYVKFTYSIWIYIFCIICLDKIYLAFLMNEEQIQKYEVRTGMFVFIYSWLKTAQWGF